MNDKLKYNNVPVNDNKATIALIYSSKHALIKKADGSRQLQIDICRQYCKSKGYLVVGEYGERRKHTSKEDRMAHLEKMLKYVRTKGRFIKVIVYSLDQFASSGVTSLKSLNALLDDRMDIEIATLDMDNPRFARYYKSQFDRLVLFIQRNR